MKYRLIDRYSKDVVYEGNNLNALKKAFKNYNLECEDDWFPGLTVDGKVVADFTKYCY